MESTQTHPEENRGAPSARPRARGSEDSLRPGVSLLALAVHVSAELQRRLNRGPRVRPKNWGSGEGRSPLPNPLEPQDDCRQSQPRGEPQYSHAPGLPHIARPGDGTPAAPCSRCTWGSSPARRPGCSRRDRVLLDGKPRTRFGSGANRLHRNQSWNGQSFLGRASARHPAGPSRPVPASRERYRSGQLAPVPRCDARPL